MKDRTKALQIPYKVKQAVANRDSVEGWPCCVLCGRPAPTSAPLAFSCAHYIARSQGGLGIEENILTLCPDCHGEYDGKERNKHKPYLTQYLRRCYRKWDEKKLTYQK